MAEFLIRMEIHTREEPWAHKVRGKIVRADTLADAARRAVVALNLFDEPKEPNKAPPDPEDPTHG